MEKALELLLDKLGLTYAEVMPFFLQSVQAEAKATLVAAIFCAVVAVIGAGIMRMGLKGYSELPVALGAFMAGIGTVVSAMSFYSWYLLAAAPEAAALKRMMSLLQ